VRITVVTETYLPQVNGVSRTLGQLAAYLRGRGDAVQVVHPRYPEGQAGPEDVTVPAARMPFYRELCVPQPPFWGAHEEVAAFRPDIVHIATEWTLGLSFLNVCHRRGWPVVSSFHTNFDQYCGHYGFGWSREILWRYMRWFHNRTRETYVPSPGVIADLEGRGFERLQLWPRGVDGEIFRPDRPGRERIRAEMGFRPDEVVVGHIGRLAAEKNVGFLGQALRRVEDRRPGVRFLIVGDGPARPELERLLGPAAKFAGYRSGEDLADHYAACDLFAFASTTETFGNVILEAMAAGLPVVALRAGGVADILRDGETGRLVDQSEPPGRFDDALVELIDSAGERERLSAAARAYALSQTWGAINGRLRDRYEAVLASGS
jgi:glycosyltransferase involved in cell wall biosynthesis